MKRGCVGAIKWSEGISSFNGLCLIFDESLRISFLGSKYPGWHLLAPKQSRKGNYFAPHEINIGQIFVIIEQ
jgi:hypothetical protein